MSVFKQILLSLVVIVIAAGGWFAYDRGWFIPIRQTAAPARPAAAGSPPGAGQADQQASRGARAAPGVRSRGAAPVITAPVTTADDGVQVDAIGTVGATQSITIYPQVTGIVAEVDFTQGATVAAGQTLVHLVDDDKQVAVAQAQLALDTANQALGRVQRLAKTNNATAVSVDDAETAVRKAEIDLKAAQIDLAKYTITAPFAGVVGLSDIAVGDLVTTQKPITTLDNMATLKVSFVVPERASGLVADGQAVSATTAALPGKTFVGKISAVDSRADPVTRTLAVEATVSNDANILKPGMAMDVSMSFPGVQRPVVPSLAVQWDKNGPYVWKIKDATAHRIAISIIGRRSGEVLLASNDLAVGDEVVVEGLQRLRDGATVTPAAAAAPSSGSS